MTRALAPAPALALVILCSSPSGAVCPPSCPVPGGGAKTTDCHVEFSGPGLRLNFPHFIPANPRPARQIRCFDGEPGCDLDGEVDGSCRFPIDLCLRNADPALPQCVPADVSAVSVQDRPPGNPDLAALQAAVDALLPATTNVCTSGQTVAVPLKGGGRRKGRLTVKVSGTTATGVDTDRARLVCIPHGWPSHGYDRANRRASATESSITPANASQLVPKWQFTGGGVSSTPTVANGVVYATSWNGNAYALDARTGVVRWQYDTLAPFTTSSPTLTADGRVLFGDSAAVLHCLDARTGTLRWKTPLGDPAVDHVWASPTVASGRVIVGVASHNDIPCTQGRVLGLDLDTGAILWTRIFVPDDVCDNDTSVVCTSDGDCGGGVCRPGRGAGVTATVALDPSGESVFVNTVGCFTYPSIGDSDSILRLDAATGAVAWKTRVQPPEQFHTCSNDPTRVCTGTLSLGCVAPGVCSSYHDFGFLNGPILVDADDGLGGTRPLVVSGSKDGTLYALDASDGSPVWTNVVAPTPVTPAFAGFGLFNAAVGFADQRFHAALFDHVPSISPAPKHLMAFSAVDGAGVWEDEIGESWGSVALANGVLFVGANETAGLFVYDAALGTRLTTLALPETTTSGASIVDGSVYVGFGVATGGVQAFTLP
jgi:outer membrane protein assembly factor BamB